MDIELNQDGEPIRLYPTSQEWRDCTESVEPDWEPLERTAPAHLWGEFMWMYRVRPEVQGIEAYKHRDARHYLHLEHSAEPGMAIRRNLDPWSGRLCSQIDT